MNEAETTYTVLTLECAVPRAEETADLVRGMLNMEPVEVSRPGSSVCWLDVYFTDDTRALLARDALAGADPIRAMSLRTCRPRDWQSFWQHHFTATPLGRRLLIVPEWEAASSGGEDRLRVLVHPGLSFGTGDHFTTRFCLEGLEDWVDSRGPGPVLDAGTGSGIIAITAALLGCPEPFGFDNDAIAVNQARENAVLNGVEGRVRFEVLDLTVSGIQGSYPLVCANLYFGLLTGFAPALARACSGRLVLSGLREFEGDAVSQVYAEHGFVEQGRDGDGEWCGLILEKE